jgi:hypothetical protein
MRTPQEHPDTFSLSDAGFAIDTAMCEVERTRLQHQHARERLHTALLDAALYSGMSKSAMSRITGYSRKHIARLLREATPFTDDTLASTGSSVAHLPNL